MPRDIDERFSVLLAALCEGSTISDAARTARLSFAAVTARRRRDPRFDSLVDEILQAHGQTRQRGTATGRIPNIGWHEPLLQLVKDGSTVKEAAATLSVPYKTVYTHVRNYPHFAQQLRQARGRLYQPRSSRHRHAQLLRLVACGVHWMAAGRHVGLTGQQISNRTQHDLAFAAMLDGARRSSLVAVGRPVRYRPEWVAVLHHLVEGSDLLAACAEAGMSAVGVEERRYRDRRWDRALIVATVIGGQNPTPSAL